MGFLPNETITTVLRHYQNTTGVTAWTKNLFANGGSSAVTVNTAEIGSGYYSFNFTPNAEGYWHLDVYETADDTVHYMESYEVGSLEVEVTSASLEVSVSDVNARLIKLTSDIQRLMADVNNLFVQMRRVEGEMRK